MACCSDLNCEGNYQWCITNCNISYPGSQSCLDGCHTQSVACANTRCDDCGRSMPCWFNSGDPSVECGWPGSGQSCASNFFCSYPYVCLDGSCVQGGCGVTTQCGAGFHCSGGFCLPGQCSADNECQAGQHCVSNSCS